MKTELLSNFQSLDYAACFFFIISIHEAIVRKKASIRVYSKNTTLRVSNNRKTIFMFTALSRVSYECDELEKKADISHNLSLTDDFNVTTTKGAD